VSSSTPPTHKHQLSTVGLLLSRPDPVPVAKIVHPSPPAGALSPLILWDEASTLDTWASNWLGCRLLDFDRAV